jgi:hypothetical protein
MRLSPCIPALRFSVLVLAFSIVAALNATAATKAVNFGKLWDGHGTIANAVVIVENDKIQSVAASGTIPAGAEIIDLTGIWKRFHMFTIQNWRAHQRCLELTCVVTWVDF